MRGWRVEFQAVSFDIRLAIAAGRIIEDQRDPNLSLRLTGHQRFLSDSANQCLTGSK